MARPRFQATPRGRQWAVEPRRRWRPWAEALLLLVVLLACGTERVTF